MKSKNSSKIKDNILNKRGLFVVKACPGSGKTSAVASRLAKYLKTWKYSHKGVATISFTNIAWQEIEEYLSADFNLKTPIKYPHFLGTIDSFINQYMFLPFGHLIIKCCHRPSLVGEPAGKWHANGLASFFDNYTFDISGKLICLDPKRIGKKLQQDLRVKIEIMKKGLLKEGYCTQLDANFIAMKILDRYSSITRSLVTRFPLVMIDEAQDTSEIQMRIIELLIKNGLKELMLVGDSDQAIYEWRDAKPQLFLDKYKEWKENSFELNENWRSSQKICDFSSCISSFKENPRAMNAKYRSFTLHPEIWGWHEDNFREIITKFLGVCKNHSISFNSQNIAIVVRSHSMLSNVLGEKKLSMKLDPWNNTFTRDIAKSRYLYDRQLFYDGFKLLESTVCKVINKKNRFESRDLYRVIKKFGFIGWRSELSNVMRNLPKSTGKLLDWIDKVNRWISSDQSIIKGMELKIKRDRRSFKYSELSFDEVFKVNKGKVEKPNFTLGTVHSAKGATFDAVLLIVKEKGANNRKYINIIQENIIDSEELRIVYVAISRPRKILVIAVPKKDENIWEERFYLDNKN